MAAVMCSDDSGGGGGGGGTGGTGSIRVILNVLATPISEHLDRATFNVFSRSLKYTLKPHALTGDLPLVKSPSQLIVAIAVYLCIVILALLHSSLASTSSTTSSKQKKPRWSSTPASSSFALTCFMLIHNGFLVALSAFMCVAGIAISLKKGYLMRFVGNGMDDRDAPLANLVYIFYVSKIYEFLDTVIMILKGNMRQVSFLHVYHHVSISIIWWAICYDAPGGEAYLSIIMNSAVHTAMYAYYFLAAVIKDDDSAKTGKVSRRARWLWWGVYLTRAQMAQFLVNLIHGALCVFFSPYPKFYSIAMTVYMLSLLLLFGHFYAAKYLSKKKTITEMKKKKKKDA